MLPLLRMGYGIPTWNWPEGHVTCLNDASEIRCSNVSRIPCSSAPPPPTKQKAHSKYCTGSSTGRMEGMPLRHTGESTGSGISHESPGSRIQMHSLLLLRRMSDPLYKPFFLGGGVPFFKAKSKKGKRETNGKPGKPYLVSKPKVANAQLQSAQLQSRAPGALWQGQAVGEVPPAPA